MIFCLISPFATKYGVWLFCAVAALPSEIPTCQDERNEGEGTQNLGFKWRLVEGCGDSVLVLQKVLTKRTNENVMHGESQSASGWESSLESTAERKR